MSHGDLFRDREQGKLLWAGGRQQVKLIDGYGVPLFAADFPHNPATVSRVFGGLPPFGGPTADL